MLEWLLTMFAISGLFAILGAMSDHASLWHRLGAMCMGMAFSQAAFVAAVIAAAFSMGLLTPVALFALTGVPYYVAKAFVNPGAEVKQTEP